MISCPRLKPAQELKELPSATVFPPVVVQTALPDVNQVVTTANGVVIQGSTMTGRHQYSTRTALNLNGTKLLDNLGRIYDHPSGTFLMTSGVNSETVWSYNDPNKLYGIQGGTLRIVDISSGSAVSVDTGIPASGIGSSEGGISGDDQFITIDTATSISVYSLVGPSYALQGSIPKFAGYDSHKISLDGNYVVVDGGSSGVIYNRDMTNPRNIVPNMGHNIMAVDCNGRQVLVHKVNSAQSLTVGAFTVTDLVNNTSYPLLPTSFTFNSGTNHMSYAPGNPGTIYGSFSSGGVGWIGTIPICPNNQEYTVWTEGFRDASNSEDYACQNKASVSPDGTNVVITSCDYNGSVRDYIITCDL